MAEGRILGAKATGLLETNTSAIPSLVDDFTLIGSENMIYRSNGGMEVRKGTRVFLDPYMEGIPCVGTFGYNLDRSGAEIAAVYQNGEIRYFAVADYSEDPTRFYNRTIATNRISNIITPADPALLGAAKNSIFWQVLNNLVFFVYGTNQILYYGQDHIMHAVPDPAGFEISVTVPLATEVTQDDIYVDNADPTRQFIVLLDKTSGVGTEVLLRQIAGDTRPSATGIATFNQETPANPGDDSFTSSEIEYSDNFTCLEIRAGRLVANTNTGVTFISGPNNGLDFTGPQAERIEYGKEDGLQVTNMSRFKRGVILSLTDPELQRSSTALLTGYRKYDVNTPDRTDGLFKIDRESEVLSIFGRSGKEVGDGYIGLTKNGFLKFTGADATQEIGISDSTFISSPISNLVNRINWNFADDIRSTVDENNQRYLCSVPVSGGEGSTLMFVYDFKHSSEAKANSRAVRKWSLYTFNIGNRFITGMNTIFGHPFMCLSDGSIYIMEVGKHYLDEDQRYRSSISSKYYDFGLRIKKKSFKRALIDLIMPEITDMEIFFVVDENYNTTDGPRKPKGFRRIIPVPVDQDDVWTLDPSDVWTLNPLDVWGRSTSERYSFVMTECPKFKELGIIIQNTVGGKRWGVYGFEIVAAEDGYYSDSRLKDFIDNRVRRGVATLLPLLATLGSLCYNIL